MRQINYPNQYNIKYLQEWGIKYLIEKKIQNPALDIRVLLSHSLDLTIEQVILQDMQIIEKEKVEIYIKNVIRRGEYEPIAYITGLKEFWGIEFDIINGILIPRPDSETIIALSIKLFKDSNLPLNIFEFGVGSGCLILTLLKIFQNSYGVGIDANKFAVENSNINAHKLSLANRVKIMLNDWNYTEINGEFDLIITNPPYIKTNDIRNLNINVKDYESYQALNGGEDGLEAYRKIAQITKLILKEKGIIILEIGYGQIKDVMNIFKNHGYCFIQAEDDLQNIPRALAFSLN